MHNHDQYTFHLHFSLFKYQNVFQCFLRFLFVFFFIFDISFFLRDHNGNKAEQLFYVIYLFFLFFFTLSLLFLKFMGIISITTFVNSTDRYCWICKTLTFFYWWSIIMEISFIFHHIFSIFFMLFIIFNYKWKAFNISTHNQ